jgi:hypothetical protein
LVAPTAYHGLEVIGMREGEKRGPVGRERKTPYFENQKYPEPTLCPRCGLVYRGGRWQRAEDGAPSSAAKHPCPACRRELDRYPAGLVELSGPYLALHHQEILNIAKNQAASAAAARPLQRVMWIEEKKGTVEIATTDGHLAQRIGKAIESACKGTLVVKQASEDPHIRLTWSREA